MGRLLGRLHAIGALHPFDARPRLDVQSFGHDSVACIADGFIPPEYRANYLALTAELLVGADRGGRHPIPRVGVVEEVGGPPLLV